MKLYTAIITPFMFGNWVLRTTNDINIDKGLNYIQIKEETNFSMNIFFNATRSPVSISVALNTRPNVPFPTTG